MFLTPNFVLMGETKIIGYHFKILIADPWSVDYGHEGCDEAPNSDLNFAVEFVSVFFFLVFPRQEAPKSPPNNFPSDFCRRLFLIFSKTPLCEPVGSPHVRGKCKQRCLGPKAAKAGGDRAP